MSDYSPLKTAVIWAGAILVTLIVCTSFVLMNGQDRSAMKACFSAGNSPAECKVGVS